MSVGIENLGANREHLGHEAVHTGSHTHGVSYSHTPASEEPMVMVNQIALHQRPGHGRPFARDSVTGSATSDEDVLKGAYGGHITAGGDDLFPRDRLRAINDDNVMSPNRSDYIKGHRVTARRRSSEYSDEDEEYYDEEEEEIMDEEEYRGRYHRSHAEEHRHREERYHRNRGGGGGHDHGHQTIGPPDGDQYRFNRHRVDGDEQNIVEMITADELKRKVDMDTTEMQRYAMNNNAGSYASNLYQAQEMEQQRMDDIIHEMHSQPEDHNVGGHGGGAQHHGHHRPAYGYYED